MFNIPRKEIICNDDTQVVLKSTADITAVPTVWISPVLTGTNIPVTGNAAIQFEGFLSPFRTSQLVLLAAATRIRARTTVAAVAETAAFTIALVGSGPAQDDIVMLRMDSLDLTPTEFQNKGFEKRYQFSAAKNSVALIIAHLVATINGDKFAPVTAYAGFNNASPAQDDSAKITLVAKKTGQNITDFIGDFVNPANGFTATRVANGTAVYGPIEDALNTTAAAVLGINTYDYLKNINWAKNFNIDQNISWMPLPGATYTSYYFEVNGALSDTYGNSPIPNEVHGAIKTAYTIWAKTGGALATAMDFLVIDMNI